MCVIRTERVNDAGFLVFYVFLVHDCLIDALLCLYFLCDHPLLSVCVFGLQDVPPGSGLRVRMKNGDPIPAEFLVVDIKLLVTIAIPPHCH